MRLATNRLDAKPNNDRMRAGRNTGCGRQLSLLHSSRARTPASITGWDASVHTPQPATAMSSEAIPEKSMESRFIRVSCLKRTCLFSRVVCIIVNELTGSARNMIADSSTSRGWLKKRAISGEHPSSVP